jgi:hypothetical protein
MRPQLEHIYKRIVIVVEPKDLDPADLERVKSFIAKPKIDIVISPQRPWSRYLALQASLETSTAHIHYVDMDRLLHWLETRPLEWQQTVEVVSKTDCLIIGRTEQAFQTHPQAIQQTEKVINAVFSHLLGRPVDLGGGSRGFSRRCVELLVAASVPGRWTDAEWPALLHQAGFAVDYLAVDGLDWETADRYQQQAADAGAQRRLATAYDSEAKNWRVRVEMALEIIQAGLEAMAK